MLNLTPEQEALLSLLQGEKVKNADSLDWEAIKKEAFSQAVFLLVAKSKNLPKQIASGWSASTFTAMWNNIQTLNAAAEMDEAMRSAGENYVILKGLAAASYYPTPMLRALGDVDYLIDPSHQARIENAMKAYGFERTSEEKGYHVVFIKGQMVLEMHVSVPGMPKNDYSDSFREYFKNIINETIPYSYNDKVFRVPKDQYHGLVLILHTLHHMLSSGFGLRHLMDWGYFVQKTEKEKFWQETLLPFLKQVGLLLFAQVITKTSAIYLHTACPDWVGEVDEALCDAMMKDILIGGNFGRKERSRNEHSKYIINRSQGGVGDKSGFAQALTAVVSKSKEEGRSVAAVLFEYAGKIIRGKRKLDSLKVVRGAAERKKIYDQLHLFETRESKEL